jgi:hypothetical protein
MTALALKRCPIVAPCGDPDCFANTTRRDPQGRARCLRHGGVDHRPVAPGLTLAPTPYVSPEERRPCQDCGASTRMQDERGRWLCAGHMVARYGAPMEPGEML